MIGSTAGRRDRIERALSQRLFLVGTSCDDALKSWNFFILFFDKKHNRKVDMDSAKEPGAKWTLESLKHVFETRGVTLLDIGDQRITGTEKYRYICACGRECARTPSNMLKGRHPCRDCATRNRTEKCKSQNEALRQARKRKHEETATEKAGKIEEKEQDPPKLQHRPRKMIYLGPRWPDPKPRREDFPSLSKHEWLNLQARWRTSTPEYKRANNERYKRRVQEEGAAETC